MNVVYTEKAKQARESFCLMQQATERLKEIVHDSSVPVEVVWDRVEDAKGRSLYKITLSDPYSGTVSEEFAPDELGMRSHVRYRLLDLWGDLLQARSHRQIQELKQSAGE